MVVHSAVFKILLQIEFKKFIMGLPPVSTNSFGMLSTPAVFPVFIDLTAADTFS